jgi:hypothetical protein
MLKLLLRGLRIEVCCWEVRPPLGSFLEGSKNIERSDTQLYDKHHPVKDDAFSSYKLQIHNNFCPFEEILSPYQISFWKYTIRYVYRIPFESCEGHQMVERDLNRGR